MRALLAEKDYFICTPAKRFKHGAHDFLAIPKGRPLNCLIVSPRTYYIFLRPFASPDLYRAVTASFTEAGLKGQIYWAKQVSLTKRNLRWWHLVPPASLAYFAKLTHTTVEELTTELKKE